MLAVISQDIVMNMSIEDQLAILRNMRTLEQSLLPKPLQEVLFRMKQAEEIGAVGGYYEEPVEEALAKRLNGQRLLETLSSFRQPPKMKKK